MKQTNETNERPDFVIMPLWLWWFMGQHKGWSVMFWALIIFLIGCVVAGNWNTRPVNNDTQFTAQSPQRVSTPSTFNKVQVGETFFWQVDTDKTFLWTKVSDNNITCGNKRAIWTNGSTAVEIVK
jgi:hypothetical protein